jgi:hypothetical protein
MVIAAQQVQTIENFLGFLVAVGDGVNFQFTLDDLDNRPKASA